MILQIVSGTFQSSVRLGRGRTGIRLSPQTFSSFFLSFKMEDDSPVIYGLELNVSSQFIPALFLGARN